MERKSQRLRIVSETLKSLESKLRSRENLLGTFVRELDSLLTKSSSDWKEGLRSLHRTFVSDLKLFGDADEKEASISKVCVRALLATCVLAKCAVWFVQVLFSSSAHGADGGGVTDEAINEYNRQRETMERALSTMQRKAEREAALAEAASVSKLKENSVLLGELNAARMERMKLLKRVSTLEVCPHACMRIHN
jgi:hypothetical protein